ncbi:hypothetical protein AB1Y20_018914 [Prymnesium parvum]|uniref:Apple domain-containing protein n=1 Tax=Prymnesium parvum TaxID=97485 RepID=A0AB34JQV5_PRYPA
MDNAAPRIVPRLFHHFDCEGDGLVGLASFASVHQSWTHLCWDSHSVALLVGAVLPNAFSNFLQAGSPAIEAVYGRLAALYALGGIAIAPGLVSVRDLGGFVSRRHARSVGFVAGDPAELLLVGSPPQFGPWEHVLRHFPSGSMTGRRLGRLIRGLAAETSHPESNERLYVVDTQATWRKSTVAVIPMEHALRVVDCTRRIPVATHCVISSVGRAGGPRTLAVLSVPRITPDLINASEAAALVPPAFAATEEQLRRLFPDVERLTDAIAHGEGGCPSQGAGRSGRQGTNSHICILMVDNRALPPLAPHAFNVHAARRKEQSWSMLDVARSAHWDQLTPLINLAYAKKHGYTFLRAQYHKGLIADRAYLWSKVLVMWRVAVAHKHCQVVTFIDSDATFESLEPLVPLLERTGLLSQPRDKPASRLFLLPKEPPGNNPFKDFRGNNIDNTRMSTGFIAFRNTGQARRMLLEWWFAPQRSSAMRRYLHQWAHEQRVWNDAIRPKYPHLWVELPEHPESQPLLSTPHGSFVRHMWWKNNATWEKELKKRVYALYLQPGAPLRGISACSYPLLLDASATRPLDAESHSATGDAQSVGSTPGAATPEAEAPQPPRSHRNDCEAFSLLRGYTMQSSSCDIPALTQEKCVVERVPSVGKCCQVCTDSSTCNAFVYLSRSRTCQLRSVGDEIKLARQGPAFAAVVSGDGPSLSWTGIKHSHGITSFDTFFRLEELRDGWKARPSVVVLTSYSS